MQGQTWKRLKTGGGRQRKASWQRSCQTSHGLSASSWSSPHSRIPLKKMSLRQFHRDLMTRVWVCVRMHTYTLKKYATHMLVFIYAPLTYSYLYRTSLCSDRLMLWPVMNSSQQQSITDFSSLLQKMKTLTCRWNVKQRQESGGMLARCRSQIHPVLLLATCQRCPLTLWSFVDPKRKCTPLFSPCLVSVLLNDHDAHLTGKNLIKGLSRVVKSQAKKVHI